MWLTAGQDCGISDIERENGRRIEKSKISIHSVHVTPHFPAFRISYDSRNLLSMHAPRECMQIEKHKAGYSNREKPALTAEKKERSVMRVRPALERAVRCNYMQWCNRSIMTCNIDFYCVSLRTINGIIANVVIDRARSRNIETVGSLAERKPRRRHNKRSISNDSFTCETSRLRRNNIAWWNSIA